MNNEIKTVSPFKNFCMTIGNLPTSYLESMSYYETLCWLIKYLENTIKPAVNQNAEALKELQYYVENLDLTDEVNARLDEMAESGELAHIINVEMIGTLSDLTTTDKTDLVSAVNEVNANIKNFNITNYDNYTKSNINIVSGVIELSNESSITVAYNDDGSICKIYGALYPDDKASSSTFEVTISTALRPTSPFTIYPAGIVRRTDNDIEITRTVTCYVATNGNITIRCTVTNNEDFGVYLWPCLYFVKDFGDVGI